MKLFFFLIAFCLILLRAYFSWSGHSPSTNNEGTVTIENGDYYEQVKWSGKTMLSDDEKSIATITPGGYLKFRENDAKMTAESNLKGEIHYKLYDGDNELPLDDSGRNFLAASLKKMIARGFYADGRAERINKKGGYKALIAELPNLEMQNIKNPYLDLIFNNDSLSGPELANAITQTTNAVSDIDKENFLKKVTPLQRKDPLIFSAWMDIVTHMNSDIQKANLLSLVIEQDSLSEPMFDRIITITTSLNSDLDKMSILARLINKSENAGDGWSKILEVANHFNSDLDKMSILTRLLNKSENADNGWSKILEVANHFNSDLDKQNIYTKLITKKNISDEQWINIINSASQQNSDLDKASLLVSISKEMPRSENIKTAYLAAAKKINDDASYGKAVKEIQ